MHFCQTQIVSVRVRLFLRLNKLIITAPGVFHQMARITLVLIAVSGAAIFLALGSLGAVSVAQDQGKAVEATGNRLAANIANLKTTKKNVSLG